MGMRSSTAFCVASRLYFASYTIQELPPCRLDDDATAPRLLEVSGHILGIVSIAPFPLLPHDPLSSSLRDSYYVNMGHGLTGSVVMMMKHVKAAANTPPHSKDTNYQFASINTGQKVIQDLEANTGK
jgi:hypothetical protein